MTMLQMPRRPAPPVAAGKPKVACPSIGKIETDGVKAVRMAVNAVEGFGKTTIAAYAPNPLIIETRDETGYETLLSAGLVPSVDVARVSVWDELLAVLDQAQNTEHQTIAIDAATTAEKMCHEHVCTRDFNGDWSERGFSSYQKGYELAVKDWEVMLSMLDKIHRLRHANIIILVHARMRTFNDPAGPSFDRYEGDLHKKTWASTARWADVVLFGTFATVVVNQRTAKGEQVGKGKGIGTGERVIHTTRRDAWEAKNRYGMADTIELHDVGPAETWARIWSEITHK
ncbi:MAG: ATP-binding protein [Bryobacteraceae bacterium]